MTKARTLADNYAADINQITASAPLTGGGTSGTVTVGIQAGTTAQSGAVQLTDSTASTSTTTAATPNSVKSAYDLANGAVAKSLVDAKGDLLVGSANDTVSRLAVASTAGYLLTVDSAEATGLKWGAPPSSGGMTLLSTTTLANTSTTISSISQDYNDLLIIVSGINLSGNDYPRIDINGATSNVFLIGQYQDVNNTQTQMYFAGSQEFKSGNTNNVTMLRIFNYASTAYYKAVHKITQFYIVTNTEVYGRVDGGSYLSTSAVSSIKFTTISGASFNAGQVKIYGVK